MSSFRSLLNVELRSLLTSKSMGRSAKRRNAALVTYIILVPAILVMSGTYSYLLVYGLDMYDGAGIVVPLMAALSCVTTFVTGMSMTSSTLFKARFNDLLLSMPIRVSTVVATRLTKMYLFNLAVDVLITLPAVVIYAIAKAPGFLYYVNYVVCLVLLPMIPLTLAAIVGAVITAVVSRFRYKNLLTTVLSIAALMVYMISVFSFSSNTGNHQAMYDMISGLMSIITRIYPPVTLLSRAIIDENALYMLAFSGLSVAVFALFCFALSTFYLQISTRLNSTARRGIKVDIKSQKAGTARSAIFMRELKRYFSIPIYVMNTFTGMALVVLLTCGIIFAGEDAVTQLIGIPGAAGIIAAILPFIMGFCISMTCSSASSISLEGKQLWILRSSPVSTADIFIAKVGLNVLLTAPITLICSVVLGVFLKLTGVSMVMIILTPLAYCLLTAFLGLTINLHFPKMDWTAEVQAVKQSTAVLITILTGMVLSMGPLFVAIFGFDPVTVQAVTTGILIVLTALLFLHLKLRGRALWERVS